MPTQQQPSNDQQQQSTNYILLKILQRQPAESNSETVTTTANSHHNHHQSLTSKILKKFGVSHQNQPDKSNVNTTSSTAATTTSTANLGGSSYRYVDVKLPKSTTANLNSPQSSSSTSTSTTRRNSFDPNVQKSFVYTTIMERENRLKQQRERFQLIDEMIREAEKKSRLPSSDLLAANSLVRIILNYVSRPFLALVKVEISVNFALKSNFMSRISKSENFSLVLLTF
jgi:hypothetical protein